jgi:hypothetical protein
VPVKISQIKDKPQKLKAYIEQKKSAKFKEALETRSPFIPYVPVGRWVEKKEEPRKPKNVVITTPMRKALMNNDKILKKPTMKELITTAKKDISTTTKKAFAFVGSKKVESNVKSRKKILAEPNEIVETLSEPQMIQDDFEDLKSPIEPLTSPEPLSDLNSTFEVIKDSTDNENSQSEEINEEIPLKSISTDEEVTNEGIKPKKELLAVTKQPSKTDVKALKVKKDIRKVEKKVQPKSVSTDEEVQNENVKPKKTTAKASKVMIKKDIRKIEKKVPVKKEVPSKKVVPAKKVVEVKKPVVTAKIVKPVKRPFVPKETSPLQSEESPEIPSAPLTSVKPSKPLSHTYKFYKSSLDNQSAYLTLQLKDITTNLDSYIDKLTEETQTLVHKNIQQGNRIINEKMGSFMEVLEKFENANENDVKRVTEDDVENYWDLLYEEIEKLKEEFILVREAKNYAMNINQKPKRRTTKYDVNVTPRRSRRVADRGDTPK